MRSIIDNYKASNRNIGSKCRQISEILLVKLDGKRVYDGNEFEVEQHKHRQSTLKKLRNVHERITGAMSKTFEVCLDTSLKVDLPLVQIELIGVTPFTIWNGKGWSN